MNAKNPKRAFSVIKVLRRVGWLETIGKSVVKNEENSYLLPGLACRKTCGWTHCNSRCSLRYRDSLFFSELGFAREKKLSRTGIHDRAVRKAV